ncbi:hypothetical protein NECID01_0107 [Nematocida sp. AWRm77]|nr:hypothetical protein NECID01_0107 [Nematocida sp. AWRm77]
MEKISWLLKPGPKSISLKSLCILCLLWAGQSFSKKIAKNITTLGQVKLRPYGKSKKSGKNRGFDSITIPVSHLDGFDPFKKYNIAGDYLLNKSPLKRVTNFIDRSAYQDTINAVFGDTKYFNKLKKSWKAKENIQIRGEHMESFLTMLNMANKPLYIREHGVFLKLKEINQILSLYEIFSMDENEQVSENERSRTQMDLTKRECFKENLRAAVQSRPEISMDYARILRDILYNKRTTLMTEVPKNKLDSKSWVMWSLARAPNKDLFWYLFTALCNEKKDQTTHNAVLVYVEEDYIFGQRGMRVTFGKRGSPSPLALNLTEFLVYRNPTNVGVLEIYIEEGAEVPEMQFSSVIDMFGFASLVVIKSLGNRCKINRNLSLVNILLDHEKKKQEQQRTHTLRGFMIEDYLSLNAFAKSQLMNMRLNAIGYFAELDRKRCCYSLDHPCLFPVERRDPNFFGKFSIPLAQKNEIVQLLAPYYFFFKSNTLEGLKNLNEIDISITAPELESSYKNSSLNTYLRKAMNVRVARLFGNNEGRHTSHIDMLKKLLEIESLEEIDLSTLNIDTSEMLSAIQEASSEGKLKAKIKRFSFRYDEPENRAATPSNMDGGVPSMFEIILNDFPNLSSLNVFIDQGSPAIYNIIRDMKYLLGCSTKYTDEQIQRIINIVAPVPLALSSRVPCNSLLNSTMFSMGHVVKRIFKKVVTCPNGQDEEPIKNMSYPEFMLALQRILKRTVCTIPDDDL